MKKIYLKNKKHIIVFLIVCLYIRLTVPAIKWYIEEINKCFKLEINLLEIKNLMQCIYTLFKIPQISIVFAFISVLVMLFIQLRK